MQQNKNERTTGYIFILTAGIFWGCIGLFTGYLSSLKLDSLQISFIRQFYGTVFLIPVVLIACKPAQFKIGSLQSLLVLLATGAVIEVLFDISYTKTIQTMGVSAAVVLLYTSPVFVTLISAVLFSEKITVLKTVALILNITGCALCTAVQGFSFSSFSLSGLVWGLTTGLCYALISICARLTAKDTHPFISTFYMTLFSVAVLAIIVLIRGNLKETFAPETIWAGIGDGLFATAIPYLLYFSGLHKPVKMSVAAVMASIEVVVGTAVGILVFKEPYNLTTFLGMLLIPGSIAVMNAGNK